MIHLLMIYASLYESFILMSNKNLKTGCVNHEAIDQKIIVKCLAV